MTDAQPGRPAVTRRNVLRLGGAAIPAAALLSRAAAPARHRPRHPVRAGRRRRRVIRPSRSATRCVTGRDGSRQGSAVASVPAAARAVMSTPGWAPRSTPG